MPKVNKDHQISSVLNPYTVKCILLREKRLEIIMAEMAWIFYND